MTWPVSVPPGKINLFVQGRIEETDARRQFATAEEVLRRLTRQPGIVLADEVGMGKTFVALSVAVAAAWADEKQRPVVVMVPASLKQKWPHDYEVFRERCLTKGRDRDVSYGEASNGLEFFRLLDRTARHRPRLIFLTHGALSRNLDDPWVKFAVLKAAMRGRHLGDRRGALPRFAARILQLQTRYGKEELYERLLRKDTRDWNDIIASYGPALEEAAVPDAIGDAIESADNELRELGDLLYDLPIRESDSIGERLVDIRRSLRSAFQEIWRTALKRAAFQSPLVILDEAHHLKNPQTDLAKLFVTEDSEADANVLSGALDGDFERMLFLTATPFQLGHNELLNVLDRFKGANWRTLEPALTREAFTEKVALLRVALDDAQHAALALDEQWARLRHADIVGEGDRVDADAWWSRVVADPGTQSERAQEVWRAYQRADATLRAAEVLLRPWVVRHLRSRTLLPAAIPRRVRLAGDGLRSEREDAQGLPIADSAILPFLLAARAQAMVARVAREQRDTRVYRATFAEGLASSFEAFLETRKPSEDALDDVVLAEAAEDPRLRKYMQRLQDALQSDGDYRDHPKVSAVVDRVTQLWAAGEKVVVFCHYRVTGKVLVTHISNAILGRLNEMATRRVAGTGKDPGQLLRSWDDAFDRDGVLDRTLRDIAAPSLAASGLRDEETARIADVLRRFTRTSLFLVRYVDLAAPDRPEALRRAFSEVDTSGTHLGQRLEDFLRFLTERCTERERAEYLDALERIQPGGINFEEHNSAEQHRPAKLVPTVRLASGAVPNEVRRRLLLGFNTPFLPEILVASSVMAEGVDLHLNCRHMIHHDLAWNPSTIEQRTGRIDRIGAKAERVQQSIRVYLPYVGGTQDEKMYRVVMDRERWFQIVMGETYRTDELATDALAERVPLPESVCRQLALRLEVVR